MRAQSTHPLREEVVLAAHAKIVELVAYLLQVILKLEDS